MTDKNNTDKNNTDKNNKNEIDISQKLHIPKSGDDFLKNYSEEEIFKIFDKIDDKDFEIVNEGIAEMEARKAKEKSEKMNIPELEPKNHRIDEGMDKKEKLANGWKEEERSAYINGTETKIKVLKKELAPGAYVWEYQDDGQIPKHLVGEQLFNRKAVLDLGLKDKLPTQENMQTMRGNDHDAFMKKNFKKGENHMFPGCRLTIYERFYGVGERTVCWLAGGFVVKLDGGNMVHGNSPDPEFGFSLRLLKD